MDPDPDPGGPKTYGSDESGFGSVSATLVKTLWWFRVELRDHDHVVECVAWAPDSASEAINEAAAMDNKNRY